MMFLTLLFLTISGGGHTLTVVQKTATVSIPPDFPVGAAIYRIVAIDDISGEPAQDVHFKISKMATFTPLSSLPPHRSAPRTAATSHFSVDSLTGTVVASPHRPAPLSDFIGYTYALDITAITKESRDTMTIVITIANQTKDLRCTPKEETCFTSSEYVFVLPESVKVDVKVGTFRPITHSHVCSHFFNTYSLISRDELPLSVRDSSGEVQVIRPLDFEILRSYKFNVSCTTSFDDNSSGSKTFTRGVTLVVKDLNDNSPYLQNSTNPFMELNSSDVIPGKRLPLYFTAMDKDSKSVNHISVELDDPSGEFTVKGPTFIYNYQGFLTIVSATVIAPKVPFVFNGSYYNFSLSFIDRTVISEGSNKVTFHVKIYDENIFLNNLINQTPSGYEVVVNMSRRAGQYARVALPMKVPQREGYFFRLSSKSLPSEKSIFGVTKETGIIYIKNETRYYSSPVAHYRLKLVWRSKDKVERHCYVVINIIENNDHNTCRVLSTCAQLDNEESCQKRCGPGSPDGFCMWRNHSFSIAPNSYYATCSPDFSTCPDEHCDELESMDNFICPQDCALNVYGEAIRPHTGKGIGKAAAPCTCDGFGTCICRQLYPPVNSTKNLNVKNNRRGVVRTVEDDITDVQKKFLAAHGLRQHDLGACGAGCIAMIGVVSIVVMSLILVAILAAIRHVRNSQTDKHRHVGNRVPLTTVVSDYVDDRTVATMTSELPTTSSVSTTTTEIKSMIDDKWEFRRDRLILQETLGEGEFGRVYKAQAWSIAQRPGYTTVAVKTLKENSTSCEEQNLLSELNLLRDVSHPNVIKLLGACTIKGGPLYIIVEYAELGSLKAYLRKLKLIQGTADFCVSNPSYFSSDDLQRYSYFTIKQELLSFAWQIAKGMAYLSDMKLVHRDLAARNILLDQGKVIKISDFGLSRDVYEGDTYLKTTESRIPVKWMAIESLEEQVYTIKSDVWSFGIVLWELITLGMTPYPGCAPGRVYQLLKDGYRMPQPDACPNKLYKLMRMCWRDVPHERPSFKELVEKMEHLLEDTVEYLFLVPENLNESTASSSSYLNPNVAECETTPKGDRTKEIPDNVNENSKVSKNHKPPILQFAHATENGYESRLLLPSSPTDTIGGDVSV